MSKSLDGFQFALFFKQNDAYDAERLCEAAVGTLPDTTERQKATGVTTATVTEDQVQVRFVLGPIRCDVHFTPQVQMFRDEPPKSLVPLSQLYAYALNVVQKTATYLESVQRVGFIVAQVQSLPSAAAALTALKKSLPFEFGVGPASEDVVVQYNIRREIHTSSGPFELNQLHNKSTGQAQTLQFGPEGAQSKVFMVFRESLDINTTVSGHELSGIKLQAVVAAMFKQMSSELQG